MDDVRAIIKDQILTYEQKVLNLARAAENSLDVLNIDDDLRVYKEKGIICDLNEGNAPYRPRYIVPDYNRFIRQGSAFLGLRPPENIWEAVHGLLILYQHVPSITSFPVYIGNLDTLFEPFVQDEEAALQAIKLFLTHIDRTITDSFCHANIGPQATKAGSLILQAERELQNAVPNITLKYHPTLTPDNFLLDCINTALVTAKPSFANELMFSGEFSAYAIASCYNGLPLGGGSYTLVRLNLAALAKQALDQTEFINRILPDAVAKMANYMDSRIKFLVEESGFLQSSFLVREGLIHKDRFTAMFGMFGLAECVNYFAAGQGRFGNSVAADDLGYRIMEALDREVKKHFNPYCQATNGRFLLHAQVGIDTDQETSPGCRIPVGEEPELAKHLLHSARFHKFFPSGIGDIFPVDSTAKQNPQAIRDIIKGAFQVGLRYMSIYSSDSDVVRITGYLVKKSEMEKLDRGEQVLQDTVALGLGAVKNQKALQRKVYSEQRSNQ